MSCLPNAARFVSIMALVIAGSLSGVNPLRAQPPDQARRGERVGPQGEEVVVDPDPVDGEQLRQRGAQPGFTVGARRHPGGPIDRPAGRGQRGAIDLAARSAGQRGEPLHSHYAATKGAVIAMTKSLAAELGPRGITVNCVAPGWVATDMTADALRDYRQRRKIREMIPLGRVATPDEIAGPILFLASDLASHVNGEVLNVNGGSVLCG